MTNNVNDVLEGNNNFTIEDLKQFIEKNSVESTEDSMSDESILDSIPAENLLNQEYVFWTGSFIIVLFIVLSFADVSLTFISKFISFVKTLFDHVDLSFLNISKKR